jgi:hypothetical protein
VDEVDELFERVPGVGEVEVEFGIRDLRRAGDCRGRAGRSVAIACAFIDAMRAWECAKSGSALPT